MQILRRNLILVGLFLSGCAFEAPLTVSATADGKYWVLQEPLKYKHPETKQEVSIPRGFVTDFASVPRLFWAALPPCGAYTTAAVLHDYLYWEQFQECDRECADKALLIAMEEAGVSFITREAIYNSVRIGGSIAWRSNKNAKSEGQIRIVPESYMDYSPSDKWIDIERRIAEDATMAY